jgi:hypothetical protein
MDFSKYTKKQPANCESCEFYQYDDYTDSYVCTMSLDEDEMVSYLSGNTASCPYYRFYDEYKSVQKQI